MLAPNTAKRLDAASTRLRDLYHTVFREHSTVHGQRALEQELSAGAVRTLLEKFLAAIAPSLAAQHRDGPGFERLHFVWKICVGEAPEGSESREVQGNVGSGAGWSCEVSRGLSA